MKMRTVTEKEIKKTIEAIKTYKKYHFEENINKKIIGQRLKNEYKKCTYILPDGKRKINMSNEDIKNLYELIQECEKIGTVMQIQGDRIMTYWGGKGYEITIKIGLNKNQLIQHTKNKIKELNEELKGSLAFLT